MLSLCVKLTQNLHASFHLVTLYTLGNQQLDAALVIVAQHRHEVFRLVVLTTQAQHQYTTGIGVQTNVAKHLTGVLVVFRELRATIVVMPRPNSIDIFLASLLTKLCCQTLGNAIDAADSGNNPNLVTYADITILTNIALKGSLFVFYTKFLVNRLICVFECARKIGLQIVLIHPIASFQVLTCMTNGVTILDDVFTLFNVLDKNFVASRRVLIDSDLFAIYFNDVTLFLGTQTYYN